jgi:hypothetical protein
MPVEGEAVVVDTMVVEQEPVTIQDQLEEEGVAFILVMFFLDQR